MLPLPILNVRLTPCDADWQQMTPTAQGRHCAHCDRVVHDFTNASAIDLAQAHANAPDGRLCGRFRREQLAPKPQLRQRLRRFLVALVLVCGLGLTSGEAWAQVISAAKYTPVLPQPTAADLSELAEAHQEERTSLAFTGYIEKMPAYPGGNKALMRFIQANLHYPEGLCTSGKVFVNFTIAKTGDVRDVKVLKGLGGAFDSEAVRVISLLGKWKPATRNNSPIDINYTIPISYTLNEKPVQKHKKL